MSRSATEVDMPNLNFKNDAYLLSNDPHQRKLAFTETSNLEAKDIFLCLPGLLETRNTFEPLFESQHSNSNIRMLSVDYCGRGDSDSLHLGTNYSMSRYMYDIEDLLKNHVLENHQNKNARLHLIGTSMGGVLALYLIEKFKYKIFSVVLNDIGLKIEWSALSKLNQSIGSVPIENANDRIHSRVVAEVKSPSHFDLPYQFDLVGINLSDLVKSFEGRIVLLHNTDSLMCPSEIAEFSQRKCQTLEIKSIESGGHPVAWSPQISEWVLSNLVFHKNVIN
jgi:pimeloyl-ACP methyl ester carboxylesterase